VCQEPAGVSIASVKRDQAGQATLQFANHTSCFSAEECHRIVQQQVQQQNLHNSRCVAVLPADSYQLMQVEIGNIPDAERREAVRWQLGGRIDYPPEEAVIDLYEVAPFNSEKKPLLYVVSAQQKLLREPVQIIERSELSVEVIDASEFALRNICDLYTKDDRGLALLLLLEQRGVLVIVRDGILYLVRWLSSGMDDLLPFADGDYEALTGQLDAIVLEIQRSFDYCESTFHLPMVSRLLVAQTQREIPAVVTYLNDYLATAVETFSFADVLAIPEESEQLQLNRCLLAIGGALRQENN
jgi:MSHA biogenesis protein MshI